MVLGSGSTFLCQRDPPFSSCLCLAWGSAQGIRRPRRSKDLVPVPALIEVRLEDQRHGLQGVWKEASRREPKWQDALMKAAGQLPNCLSDRLMAFTEKLP